MALAHILHSCFSGRLQAVERHRPEEQPRTHGNPARCLLQPTQGRCSANGQVAFTIFFFFFHDRASAETCGLHVQRDGWCWDDLIRSRAGCPSKQIAFCNLCSRSWSHCWMCQQHQQSTGGGHCLRCEFKQPSQQGLESLFSATRACPRPSSCHPPRPHHLCAPGHPGEHSENHEASTTSQLCPRTPRVCK